MSDSEAAEAKPESQPTLRRIIGPKLLLFFVIGDILGTGIYALTGDVAGEVGGAAWMSFGLSFIIAMFTATSYVELVGKYPQAAGAALYTQRAFGVHFLTFMVAFAVMCSGLTSAGAASRSFAGYFQEFISAPELIVAFAFLLILAAVNFRGVSESVKLNVVLTCVELSGLLLIIAIGAVALARGIGDAGKPFEFNAEGSPFGLIVGGAALAFFALVGFEDSVNMAEETTDPQKVFPKALFLGITFTGIIYSGRCRSWCRPRRPCWSSMKQPQMCLRNSSEGRTLLVDVLVEAVPLPAWRRPAPAGTGSSRCRPRTARPSGSGWLVEHREKSRSATANIELQPNQGDGHRERRFGGGARRLARGAEVQAQRHVRPPRRRRTSGPSGRCGTTGSPSGDRVLREGDRPRALGRRPVDLGDRRPRRPTAAGWPAG